MLINKWKLDKNFENDHVFFSMRELRDAVNIILYVQPGIKGVIYRSGGRRDAVKLTRLGLGHSGVNQCLHIIGKHPTGLCERGNPETIKHVFLQCNKYINDRKQFYNRMLDLGIVCFSIKSFFGNNENCHLITKVPHMVPAPYRAVYKNRKYYCSK